MKIDCRQLCELLFDYVNGDLPEDGRVLLEAHLKVCPPCVIHLETYRVTITLGRKLPCRPLSPECERRLRKALGGNAQGREIVSDAAKKRSGTLLRSVAKLKSAANRMRTKSRATPTRHRSSTCNEFSLSPECQARSSRPGWVARPSPYTAGSAGRFHSDRWPASPPGGRRPCSIAAAARPWHQIPAADNPPGHRFTLSPRNPNLHLEFFQGVEIVGGVLGSPAGKPARARSASTDRRPSRTVADCRAGTPCRHPRDPALPRTTPSAGAVTPWRPRSRSS